MVKFGESRLLDWGVVIRIGRFPVETPLGTWPGLETQSRYEAPDELQLEIAKI